MIVYFKMSSFQLTVYTGVWVCEMRSLSWRRHSRRRRRRNRRGLGRRRTRNVVMVTIQFFWNRIISNRIKTRQASSMIPSARPTNPTVVITIFNLKWYWLAQFEKWGRTDDMCEMNLCWKQWSLPAVIVGRPSGSSSLESLLNRIKIAKISLSNRISEFLLSNWIKIEIRIESIGMHHH